MPRGSSGVTISLGVDLGQGQITVNDLRAVFNETGSTECVTSSQTVNDKTYTALCNALGLQGADALAAMPPPTNPAQAAQRYTWPNLTITAQQAQQLFDYAATGILDWLSNRWQVDTATIYPASQYKQFADLRPEAQTVLFDLRFVGLLYRKANVYRNDQKRTQFEAEAVRFWQDMIGNLWLTAVQDLRDLANIELTLQTQAVHEVSNPANPDYDAALLQMMIDRGF